MSDASFEPGPSSDGRVDSEQFLTTTPPFDHEALVDFLRSRIVTGIERLDSECDSSGGSQHTYVRTLTAPHGPATFMASFASTGVRCRIVESDDRDRAWVYSTVRRFFDLDAPAHLIHETFLQDPVLGQVAARHPGLRLPNHPDGFEVAVRAIVGQQISVVAAQTVLARIAVAVGSHRNESSRSTEASGQHPPEPGPVAPIATPPLFFPTAQQIAEADPAIFPFPRARAQSLQRLASLVASGELSLDHSRNPADMRADLLAIKGIGPWTADYICMRACRERDVFLSTDLVVKHALKAIDPHRSAAEWAAVSQQWAPYRSYATLYLWKSMFPS